MKQSPLTLITLIILGVLLLKIFQHNRLLHLTHTQQHLARAHSKLLDDCINLRHQYERTAAPETVYCDAVDGGMAPLRSNTIVPLSHVLKEADNATT